MYFGNLLSFKNSQLTSFLSKVKLLSRQFLLVKIHLKKDKTMSDVKKQIAQSGRREIFTYRTYQLLGYFLQITKILKKRFQSSQTFLKNGFFIYVRLDHNYIP